MMRNIRQRDARRQSAAIRRHDNDRYLGIEAARLSMIRRKKAERKRNTTIVQPLA